MKNLLFIRKSNPQVGGVEMQMLRIAKWLREKKIIDSSLATDDLNSPLAKLFSSENFKVHNCTLDGKFYLVKAVSQLKRIIDANNIHFLQAHMFRESIICRAVKIFKPGIVNIFRIETYIDCSSISESKKLLYHRLAYHTANLVDHYIANGNLVAKELQLRSGVRKGNIKVVFNGVEKFGESDLNPIVKSVDDFINVAMVANLVKGKGHELLFEVIQELKKENVFIRVTLFGDDMDTNGNYRNELKELVSRLHINDQVVFYGFSVNLISDLNEFRIVVLPSHSEGTPNTILEAMSARKLIVASDAGELSYIIEDGISGFIHKIGDKENLKQILKNIYVKKSDEFDEIRLNSENRWKEKFSLEGMMKELSIIYN